MITAWNSKEIMNFKSNKHTYFEYFSFYKDKFLLFYEYSEQFLWPIDAYKVERTNYLSMLGWMH